MAGKCENREGCGRRGERPARRIIEGSKVVPREGKIMRSQGDPGSHSFVDNINNEQWVHVEHPSLSRARSHISIYSRIGHRR